MPAPTQLQDSSLWHAEEALINGEWIKTEQTFAVTDPATGLVLGQVPILGVKETHKAVETAHKAFLSWTKKTGKERGDVLAKIAALMRLHFDDLATIITLENGKSLSEAKVEVNMSIGQVEWMSGEAQRGYGDVIPSALPNVRNLVIKQGVGVAAIITPWNFPQSMIVRKAAAAFAAGATIVAKAPKETPFSSLAFGDLCLRAGLPKGVYNVVTTNSSSVVGSELCAHPLVRKLSFTGSTPIGRLLAAQSAATLKKCSFELGGNAPFIVFDDIDDAKFDAAVESAAAVKFRCSGQVCIASNRLLIQRGIYERFANALVSKVKQFKVGAGIDASTTHGPLINASAVEKVDEHVHDAINKGAKLLQGGQRLGDNFYAPTVLSGGTADMLVSSDETFGPLALLYVFDTEEEAIALANATEYGLAGYFWSDNLSRVWRVAEAINVGMVGINGASVSQPCAPFGGCNQSGYGREGSKYGMEEYQEIKLVAMTV
ncbi:hypothetical protein OIO90_003777 [Microbotryomycetes sp. JL221]|nr:hypothetical protein OIO90_003777 [Microbotryomycetes sp. JL221]